MKAKIDMSVSNVIRYNSQGKDWDTDKNLNLDNINGNYEDTTEFLLKNNHAWYNSKNEN